MRVRNLSMSVATILFLTAAPVSAGPKGAPAKPAGPKTAPTHGSPKTTTSSPKTTMTTTHGSPKTNSGTVASHGNAKKTASPTTTTTATTTSGTTTTTTVPTSTTTTTSRLNPIAQKISSKPQLSSKVARILPEGMTLNQASKGFKNQGQFIAALHVSQNLGIPFADLKTAMTGISPTPKPTTTGGTTTGTKTGTTTTESAPLLSLGQAIQKLRPNADAGAAATEATTQATTDLSGK